VRQRLAMPQRHDDTGLQALDVIILHIQKERKRPANPY
jgi:hypothetical protein